MNEAELIDTQRRAVIDGSTEEAVRLAHLAVEQSADVEACIDRGYVAGIKEVGRLWADGDYFLPELVQGAEAMKAAMNVLRPVLIGDTKGGAATAPKVVVATVQGDIHDIGKTLVATVLEANGFDVVDLGRDVPVERVVEAVEKESPALVGLSALLTTTMPAQARVIDLLMARGLREGVSVMVGGAPVTSAFAADIGADGFGTSAMEALAEAQRLTGTAS